MEKDRDRFDIQYRIKGKAPSPSQWDGVLKASRRPEVDVTPYIKLSLSPRKLAERIARDLMYGEIMSLFRTLLEEIDDVAFERLVYQFLHGRKVARRLRGEDEKNPAAFQIDANDLPENPFEISKLRFALHQIHEKREVLLKKTPEERSLREKLFLYRLRIDELLWILEDSEGHFAWMKEDYEKLKKSVEGQNAEKAR